MHAEHVQGEVVRGVAGTQSHKCCCYGDAKFIGEAPHRFGRVTVNYATASIDQWPLGSCEHLVKTLAGAITQVILSNRCKPTTVAG